MYYAAASDKIQQLENQLIQLEMIKQNNFIIEDLESGCSTVENLQIECSVIKDLINSCKEFVYNQNRELNFRYYEKLKEKALCLIKWQSVIIKELHKLGSDRNYELESFYNDVDFGIGDFSSINMLSDNQKQSEDFNSFIDYAINELISQNLPQVHSPQFVEDSFQSSSLDEIHPSINPNLWNVSCYELFKYLYENYYKNKPSKRKLTNIWFFLKNNTSENYNLLATKDAYKEFLETNYNISITNFDKAGNKFEEKDIPVMIGHRINFEASLK